MHRSKFTINYQYTNERLGKYTKAYYRITEYSKLSRSIDVHRVECYSTAKNDAVSYLKTTIFHGKEVFVEDLKYIMNAVLAILP